MKTSRRSSRSKRPASPGCTLDCGALVALERRERRALALIEAARREQQRVTVPAAVLAEWWRDTPGQRYVQTLFSVETTTEEIAKRAGVALGRLRKEGEPGTRPSRSVSAVDAIAMASAAGTGDIVYTSDARDLGRLATSFPDVVVIAL